VMYECVMRVVFWMYNVMWDVPVRQGAWAR
jgi:hypothetical protein